MDWPNLRETHCVLPACGQNSSVSVLLTFQNIIYPVFSLEQRFNKDPLQVEQRWIQGGLLAVLAFQLWRKFGQNRQRAASKEEWVKQGE